MGIKRNVTLIVLAVSLFLFVTWLINGSQNSMSEGVYVKKYLPELSEKAIESAKVEYVGKIGGFTSFAKIQVVDQSVLEPYWKMPQKHVFSFSGDTKELEAEIIKERFLMAIGRDISSLPSWAIPQFENRIYELGEMKEGVSRTFFLQKNTATMFVIITGN